MSTLRNTGTPVRGRRIARVVAALGIAALTGSIGACTDTPVAPSITRAAPSRSQAALAAGVSLPGVAVGGVLRAATLGQPSVAMALIGPKGGTLSIPSAGLTLTVPAGAVAVPTLFTATALPGRAVAYDFKPSGIFPVALTITQDLSATNWNALDVGSLQGAYVRDLSTLNAVTGNAIADEFEPTSVDVENGKVTFTVTHFSGYMVSTGRSSANASY
jgi:hypothetical protein